MQRQEEKVDIVTEFACWVVSQKTVGQARQADTSSSSGIKPHQLWTQISDTSFSLNKSSAVHEKPHTPDLVLGGNQREFQISENNTGKMTLDHSISSLGPHCLMMFLFTQFRPSISSILMTFDKTYQTSFLNDKWRLLAIVSSPDPYSKEGVTPSEKRKAAAPKGDKDQGEVDSSRVTSGVSIPVSTQGQARSNTKEAHEALAGPDPEPMQEDQTGSDSGKVHVSLAGPNSEHMDDEFLATAYPKVHENLKLITDERVIEDNPESHSGSINQEKTKVVDDFLIPPIPDPKFTNRQLTTPLVIAPVTDFSSPKPSSLAADIMKALKESKKMSKRQPGTGGSNEGTGNILGVPDESTIVSRASSEGTGSKPGVPDKEKLIL
ncbi:hypothetical protein Tco_1082772 [Tanacetum coccineum]|uniref:Uncharacterized protein n=1 Tax=Tanacetum coccineum TaxID=301880 RepID=A0ABQ5I303_9ASTR